MLSSSRRSKHPTNNVSGAPLTDLTGFKVYYGTVSRGYSSVIAVGLATLAAVTNLSPETIYFFAVTSLSSSGGESDFSEELVWIPPLPGPLDADGDGMSDNHELLAGTDPHDAGSALRIDSLSRPSGADADGVVLQWASVTGKSYAVERSTNLMAVPAFSTMAWDIPGQSPVTAYTDTTATGSGPYFYRVKVKP